MPRWLFLLFLLCFTCYKADSPKTAAPNTSLPLPNDLPSLEQQLQLDMQALGLPLEPQSLPESSPTGTFYSDNTPKDIVTIEAAQLAKEERSGIFRGRREEKDAKKSEQKAEQTRCQRTCDLVDNICDAAERICQLTDQLPDDPNAPARCERAQNSCRRAQTQGESCGCSE